MTPSPMTRAAQIPGRWLVAVALISAAALGYELLLMRLMAIIQWHHFAAMIISLALLGYGVSGTFLAIARERAERSFEPLFLANAALLVVAIPLCFALAQMIPFNGLALVWEPAQLWRLSALYLTLSIPFLLAANCFGLLFLAWPGSIGRVYGADLAGAGAGAVALLLALWVMRPENALLGLAGMVAVAISTVTFRTRPVTAGFFALAALGLVSLSPLQTPWLDLQPTPFKSLPQRLAVVDAEVMQERWSPYGLLTVVRSPTVPFREAPGLSLTTSALVPAQIGVFTDAHSLQTMTVLNEHQPLPEQLSFLNDSLSALPYWLREKPAVLVLEAGTGEAVLEAVFHGAGAITAQELNPQLADLSRDLYWSDQVTLVTGETRQVLARMSERFDLIRLSLGGAAAASARVDFRFTREAVVSYLNHLADDGMLVVQSPIRYPPRDGLRVLATAIDALGADAGDRLVALRNWDSALFLIRNGAFTPAELDTVRAFAAAKSFDLVWYPGIARGQTNRFHRWRTPWLYEGTVALLGDEADTFLDAYKFDVTPVSDDRPFFGQFFKAALLADVFALGPAGGALLLDAGYLIVAAALAQAMIISIVLVLLPLWLVRRAGERSRSRLALLMYFGGIGLAFLFVEIGFLQKLTLVLGDPLLTAATVLAGFLLFAGLGSLSAARVYAMLKRRLRRPMLGITAVLAMVVLVDLAVLGGFSTTLLAQPAAIRVGITLALIAPLAWLMGMLFPLGLSRVAAAAPALVPWAWAINGCASVISALAAVMASMHFGFAAIIGAGGILYVLAGATFARLPAPVRDGSVS